MKLELDWFNKVLNPNSRSHWRPIAKAKKKQRSDAFYLAKEVGTPPKQELYELNIIFHPPCKRSRDLDNCMAGIKGALDGIADAWGVNDKNFRFPNPDFGEVIKNGKIIIQLEE